MKGGDRLELRIAGSRLRLELDPTLPGLRDPLASIFRGYLAATAGAPALTLTTTRIDRRSKAELPAVLRHRLALRSRRYLSRQPHEPQLWRRWQRRLDELAHYGHHPGLAAALAVAVEAAPERWLVYPLTGGCLLLDRPALAAQLFLDPTAVPNPPRIVVDACCLALALALPRQGSGLFHAAGVLRQGRGYLFLGSSGAGKTTLARLGPPTAVYSDDVLAVGRHDGGFCLLPTPFSQIEPPAVPPPAPVSALYFLVQDRRDSRREVPPGEAFRRLLGAHLHFLRCYEDAELEPAFDLCRGLCSVLPAYDLHFRPTPRLWDVIEATPKPATRKRRR